MSGKAGKLTVTMDVQNLYDEAVAARDAFGAMADRLAREANVCTHPEGQRKQVEFGGEVHHICGGCDRVTSVEGRTP